MLICFVLPVGGATVFHDVCVVVYTQHIGCTESVRFSLFHHAHQLSSHDATVIHHVHRSGNRGSTFAASCPLFFTCTAFAIYLIHTAAIFNIVVGENRYCHNLMNEIITQKLINLDSQIRQILSISVLFQVIYTTLTPTLALSSSSHQLRQIFFSFVILQIDALLFLLLFFLCCYYL